MTAGSAATTEAPADVRGLGGVSIPPAPRAGAKPHWQRAVEWPLVIASVAFLVAYAWEVITPLSGPAARVADGVLWVTWGLFLVDYVVTLVLVPSGQRGHWFITHLLDLAIVVLPMLRPLRVLRLVTLIRVLQRTAGAAIRGRIMIYVVGATVLMVFVASLAVLDSERGAAGATITTFGDAVWWAFVTITTVGYGDLAPITEEGRMIAVALMLGGIALLGVVTATLASWIVEKVSEHNDAKDAATVAHVKSLEAKIDELRDMIARSQAVPPES